MTDNLFNDKNSQSSLPESIQMAGVAGAGGAGFPSYVKWETIDDVDYLLINHQESEPIFYGDKWIAREYADELGSFVQTLQESSFDSIAIGTKQKYRGIWTDQFEAATNAAVLGPDKLPASVDELGDIAFIYTPDNYTYSEESVLLMITVGVQIGDDLPTDHGWMVHNTETFYNIYRAVKQGKPVTRKLVHIDGECPSHHLFDVPIGTPGSVLLKEAGFDGDLPENQVLADGGPGWCYKIRQSPDLFGIRKRSNGLLILDREVAESHTSEGGEIDIRNAYDWNSNHETEPTRIEPDWVRIPLITNSAYEGFVYPSVPIVESGESVQVEDVIAEPDPNGISNTQHASIDGTVTNVDKHHIVIER